MVALSSRYLPLMRAELNRQHRALLARSSKRLPWSRRLILIKALLIHNFSLMMERAQKIHQSLISRNFSGQWVLALRHRLAWYEWMIMVFMLVLVGSFLWWS